MRDVSFLGVGRECRACRLIVLMICLLMVGLACSSVSKPQSQADKQIAQRSELAYREFEAGRYDMAVRLYRDAIAVARRSDDRPMVAQNAYNLSSCYYVLGDYTQAQTALAEAKWGYELAIPARVWLLDARLKLAQSNVTTAVEYADKAIAVGGVERDGSSIVLGYLLKEQISLDGKDLNAARQNWEGAKKNLAAVKILEAAVISGEGDLLLAEGKYAEAAGKYEQAAALYQGEGQYADMAQNLMKTGQSYEGLTNNAAAWGYYYRAAQSYLGQKNYRSTLLCIDATLKVVDKLSENEKTLTKELFEETTNAVATIEQ